MSAVGKVEGGAPGSLPPFVSPPIQQINLQEFTDRFRAGGGRELLVEGIPFLIANISPLVALGVGECLVLFGVHREKATQDVDFYAGYHIPIEEDRDAIVSFLGKLEDQKMDLYFYLLGGNDSYPKRSDQVKMVKEAISLKCPNAKVVAEETDLAQPGGVISVAIDKDGNVFWAHGLAE